MTTDKLSLEDKKKLAERMGATISDQGWEPGVIIDFPNGDSCLISDWNPDTNHAQFAEVLQHLNDDQWEALEEKFEVTGIRGALWVYENMSKVLSAVMEVIE